ncbi:unnamed protein product [Caenorhabditis nigoni]
MSQEMPSCFLLWSIQEEKTVANDFDTSGISISFNKPCFNKRNMKYSGGLNNLNTDRQIISSTFTATRWLLMNALQFPLKTVKKRNMHLSEIDYKTQWNGLQLSKVNCPKVPNDRSKGAKARANAGWLCLGLA